MGILELFMIWDFFIPRIFSLFHFNQIAFADESDNFLAGVLKKFFDFYGVKVVLKMKFFKCNGKIQAKVPALV